MGKSLAWIAFSVARPIPGHENRASTVIAPPSTKPRLRAICVTMGRRALGTMCRRRTASGESPIARAVST